MTRRATRLLSACSVMAMAVFLAGIISTDKAQGALLKSYDFNGDLTDTLGNGLDLVPSGGTVSGGRYSFGHNQGLRLDSALPGADYGIEMRFQMNDSVAGYNKFLDYQQLTADQGAYILNGQLHMYAFGGTYAPSLAAVTLNTDFTIGIVRAGGSIEVFLDGVSQFTATDPSNYANPSPSILYFFMDDNATGNSESFVGSVDFIRIHNDASTFGQDPSASAAPEPASSSLMALCGLAALAGEVQRRRRAGVLQA